MSRDVNDFAADLKAAYPGRFGFFARSLRRSLTSMPASTRRPAVSTSSARTVSSCSPIPRGRYVRDPAYDPLLEELDRRGSVLFVHPTHPDGQWIDGVPPFVIDFLLDTTRAATIMLRNRVTRRFPRLRDHPVPCCGFVPYAAERIARLLPADAAEPTGREQLAGRPLVVLLRHRLVGSGRGHGHAARVREP